MTRSLARALSILGHPTVVLPSAVLALTSLDGDRQLAWSALLGLAIFAAVVMGFSVWQVRRGHWAHVDASKHDERRTLNRFLLVVLAVGTSLGLLSSVPREFVIGLALSAAMVLLALLTQNWCKLSLHVAFALFAALLLALAGMWPLIIGLAFALLVAWSRLYLQRHALRDVIAGATAGLVAGLVFHNAFASAGS